MKYLLIIMLLFTACGSFATNPTQELLPVKVYVNEQDAVVLSSTLKQSMNDFNSFFNSTIFERTFNPDEAKIFVSCNNAVENGYCSNYYKDSIIERSDIWIRCNYEFDPSYVSNNPILLSHELYHALGSLEHFEDSNCLNNPYPNSQRTFDDLMCDKQVQEFYSLYPELDPLY